MTFQVEKPQTQKSDYLKPILIVLVIAGALLAWARFMPKPSIPLSFEITAFEGDVQLYDLQSHSWRAPKRGEEFHAFQKIKTEADGMVNLQAENEIFLRLKGNSELENKQSAVVGHQEVYQLRLERGVLFGMTTKEFEHKKGKKKIVFQVTAPTYDVGVLGATFRVEASPEIGKPNKVGVMRGAVEARTPSFLFQKAGVRIRGLEQANVIKGVIQPVTRVSQEEWGTLKEAYELHEKTAMTEAEQIDLSAHAGTLFEHVFDHGTFFTPKVGFAGREFYKDPNSGEVYMETEYDVFPTGSFVGVYIKTRHLDADQFGGLSFEVRRNPEEGSPDSFTIELKSKGNVVRRYSPRGFLRTWKKMQFDFHAQKSTPVSEVVFVFTNARVGQAKKGVLEFRNIHLIPLSKPAAAPVPVRSEVKSAALPATLKRQVKPVALTVPVKSEEQLPAPVPFESMPSKPALVSPAQSSTAKAAAQSLAVPKEVSLE